MENYNNPVLKTDTNINRIHHRVTRRVPLVEQELLTLPEHPISPQDFNGIHVTRSLVLCVCL